MPEFGIRVVSLLLATVLRFEHSHSQFVQLPTLNPGFLSGFDETRVYSTIPPISLPISESNPAPASEISKPIPKLYLPFKEINYRLFLSTLQYKIKCGDERNTESPLIPFIEVDKLVKPGKCGDFLANPYVDVYYPSLSKVQLQPVPLSQTYNRMDLTTTDPGMPREFVTSCCDANQCRDKCLNLERKDQKCQLEIYTLEQIQPYDAWWAFTQAASPQNLITRNNAPRALILRYLFRISCQLCMVSSCIKDCMNGQFASEFSKYQFGMQVVNLNCSRCAPGTWNTCIQDSLQCPWRIPEQATDRNVGLNIAPIAGGPVGKCYPCSAVRQFYVHYARTSRETLIDTSIAWKCPGGDAPPVNCPSDDFAQSENGAECVCKPGFYPFNSTFCAKCLKGHQCSKGVLEKCERHYYQPFEGQLSCMKCAEPATEDGFYRCVQPGQLLKMCDPFTPNTQDQELFLQCVPCNQCRRAFATGADTTLHPCYRDK